MADKTGIEWTDATGAFNETLYQRSRVRWSQLIWYGQQRDLFSETHARRRGREFEILALNEIFAKLAVDNVVDLTGIVSNAPFDFMADLGGNRIAIDVSTKWQKRVDAKAPLAEAFGFPFYVLLISPRDTSFFYFSPVRPTARSIRVPFALLQSMAHKFGEVAHGRTH